LTVVRQPTTSNVVCHLASSIVTHHRASSIVALQLQLLYITLKVQSLDLTLVRVVVWMLYGEERLVCNLGFCLWFG